MSISLKRKCSMVMSLFLLLSAHNLSAQSRILSLQTLVDASQTNQPSILKKQAKISSAEAAVTDARHTALPLLKLHDQVSLASANGETGTFFPLGVIVPTAGAIRAENNYRPASGNIAMLYSEYEVENFGLNKARVEDAKMNKELDEADLAKDQYLIKLKTARYYFQLLKAYHQLEIEADNVSRYDTLFTIISAQASSGIKAGADSAQTKAELSKAKVSYNSKAGEITQLKQELSFLTGIPEAGLLIDTSLLKYKQVLQSSSQLAEPENDTFNPLINYFQKQKSIYVSKEKFIKKSYLPKILLAGGVWGRGTSITDQDEYRSLSSGMEYQRFNYAIAIAFNYNIFDALHRHDKLAINKFQLQQSDYELQEQKLELNTALNKAQTAVDVINKNMKELPVQVESAAALYQQKLAQYQAGVSNLVDLTNAVFLLHEAETDNIQIVTDWFMANLDKAAARGSLNQFIQSIK